MLAEFISSRFRGRPVELYKFTFGSRPQDVALYTDSETPVTHLGLTYSPLTIQRGGTSNTGSLDKTVLDVTVPHTTKIPQMFRIYPPNSTVGLTILHGQADDPDNQFVAVWVGRVISVSFEGIEAKISCEPISTSFRRAGLRRNYQFMCPHILYGPQCQASKAAATTSVGIYAVTGREVTLTGLLTGDYLHVGGVIEWFTPAGLKEARTILSVAPVSGRTVLQLTGLASGLSAGGTADVIRGCRHTLQACKDDHDNAVNYGGHPWIPMKNPIGNVSPFQ